MALTFRGGCRGHAWLFVLPVCVRGHVRRTSCGGTCPLPRFWPCETAWPAIKSHLRVSLLVQAQAEEAVVALAKEVPRQRGWLRVLRFVPRAARDLGGGEELRSVHRELPVDPRPLLPRFGVRVLHAGERGGPGPRAACMRAAHCDLGGRGERGATQAYDAWICKDPACRRLPRIDLDCSP